MGKAALPQPSELTDLLLTVIRVSRAVQASASGELEVRHGLSLGEVAILADLAPAPDGALRMGSLSELLVTNRTAITRLVDALEAKGLVERRSPLGNRRAVNAIITEAGRKEFARVAPLLEEALGRRLAVALSAEEMAGLRSALGRMLAALGGATGRRPCD